MLKLDVSSAPQNGLSALNSTQMVEEEMLGKAQAVSETGVWEERCKKRSSEKLVKALPWKLHNHNLGWRFSVNPKHFGSPLSMIYKGCTLKPTQSHPMGPHPASVTCTPETSLSPATEAAIATRFVLMFADMLIGSLIITTRSCNWAHFVLIQGALEKCWLFPYKR